MERGQTEKWGSKDSMSGKLRWDGESSPVPQGKANGGGTQFRVTPLASESHLRCIGHDLESLNSAGKVELS